MYGSSPLLRRLALGLPTILGLAKRGYFIPYRYAAGIPARAERAAFPFIEDLFRTREQDFLDLLNVPDDLILSLADRFNWPAPPSPRWQQVWFPRLDALAAYLLVRRHRPRRIAEIGSGHSTRFAAAAIRDDGLETEIRAVDPDPRADLEHLKCVSFHRMPLQDVPLSEFEDLAPGDFLMIDSSHIAMPGSDVDILLGRIVPALPPGVFIQIHDMFLPDPYPENWTWRGYNEQLPVATLIAGGAVEPVWSSRWVATRHPAVVETGPIAKIPIWEDVPETSLWLRKIR
jgi:hypothetical protein